MKHRTNALQIGFAAGFVIGLLTIGKKQSPKDEADPTKLIDESIRRITERYSKAQTQLNRAMKEQAKLEKAISDNEHMLAILIERQQHAINLDEDPHTFQPEIDKHRHILSETKITHREALKTVEDANRVQLNEQAHYRHKNTQAMMLKAQWSFLQAKSAFINDILSDVQDGTDVAFERVGEKLANAQTVVNLQELSHQVEKAINAMETVADAIEKQGQDAEAKNLQAAAIQLKQKSAFLKSPKS